MEWSVILLGDISALGVGRIDVTYGEMGPLHCLGNASPIVEEGASVL